MTPPPGSDGGLLNAIAGSLLMTAIGVAIGTPLGMLAGTYLAEYGRYSQLSVVVRFINDILLSAPSIVIGLFVYEIVVAPMGHFSAIAGAIALAVIVVPVVVRTTENMLKSCSQHSARSRVGSRYATFDGDPTHWISCGESRTVDGGSARYCACERRDRSFCCSLP